MMPLDVEILLEDDALRLLIEITEGMDYRELEATYVRRESADEATAKQLFQLIICGIMNGKTSLRELRDACKTDLRMIYLLHGKKVPSHERFGSFIREHLAGSVCENLFYQLIQELIRRGAIELADLFVDGTKIEANANRYSFVWEKSVTKNEEKMNSQIEMKLMELQTEYCYFETPATLEGMLGYLHRRWAETGKERIHGRGCRKSKLQKDMELLEEYRTRRERYASHKSTLQGRSSYSKTDKDATFMRMKEDHMKNGQLKPGYNLQLGVEGEFVVTAMLFPDRSDTLTLLPLLRNLEKKLGKLPDRTTADAGYESEENYKGLEDLGIEAYIKPTNYEKNKSRKKDPFKAENMPYDEQTDSFTCPAGKQLTLNTTKQVKSKSGYMSEVSKYRCSFCMDCPLKAQCTKSKTGRTIQRSKVFWKYREEMTERIASEMGKQLRLNRSIQSEGTFGVLKQDWGFRRFLRRGKTNVFTETLLYLFAFNVYKLHTKISRQIEGVILHKLTAA